jgi:hypothetical protein
MKRKGGRKKVEEAMACERAEPPQKQRKKENKSTFSELPFFS